MADQKNQKVAEAEESVPTLGYHRIRGLAGGLRMMFTYKKQSYTNVAYGADCGETWFGKDKPALAAKNPCMNLPYIVDGNDVVTQSNTCFVYLGQSLGIDTYNNFIKNHTVLDQTMDVRNDLMKVVYPFGAIKTKEAFPAAAKAHLASSATTTFTKLNAYCKGPYMCGDAPQSGDFALFEMLDQHASISASIGEGNILDKFPKLKALHACMKAEPTLAPYFASDLYLDYFQNNGNFTHFTGQAEGAKYGKSITETITF